MTLLKKSDLTDANNTSSTMLSNLISDQEDAQELINAINEFVSSSTSQLKGEAYDAVRAHMETYIPILQMRMKVAASLMEAIQNANSTMVDYMEDESVLNTDDLEGLYSEYNSYSNSAQKCLNSANAYVTQEAKSQAMNEYAQYASAARKINKKIQLLECLAAKDNATYNELCGVEAELTAYKNAISDIDTIRYTTK